jgi:hypothetical protein
MTARRPAQIPPGTWPPRMMAEMAAGYCGERHVEDFLARVGTVYPKPRTQETTRRKFWYRSDLDKALGIGADNQVNDLGAKFREAIREKRRG